MAFMIIEYFWSLFISSFILEDMALAAMLTQKKELESSS